MGWLWDGFRTLRKDGNNLRRRGFHLKESSVQFSRSVVSDSLQPHESQHARSSCPSPTPRVHPNLCPLSRDVTQPSHPLLSSSPALNLSQHQDLFKWVSSLYQVAKILQFLLITGDYEWNDIKQDTHKGQTTHTHSGRRNRTGQKTNCCLLL